MLECTKLYFSDKLPERFVKFADIAVKITVVNITAQQLLPIQDDR